MGVARFCTALRMKSVKRDGNSSMDSFLSHCVKDWLLSMAYEYIDAVSLPLTGAVNVISWPENIMLPCMLSTS